jgi:tRNA A-37 threonylcarbamoyl transferase component Bud32/tetratricopeptide (TPR) repeat protein/TolB-like protein
MTLDRGARLGPYRIVERIGMGATSEVYRAVDARLQRTVAIKVLGTRHAADAHRFERLRREAQAFASVEHPHVCRIYDLGCTEALEYFVMEYLEGETLAVRIASGPLPVDGAVEIGIQIADALAWIHGRGLVHRDLKPSNVMLTRDGAKLLDFGLAKWRASDSGAAGETGSTLVGAGHLAGTLPFVSPEQIDGRPADGRSDLFALGATLYQMVTGRPAFAGETPSVVMAAILGRRTAPMTNLRADVPPALAAIIERCLEKDPSDRWASADEVAHALRTLAETPRPAPRRSRFATAAAVLLAAAAVAGDIAWVRHTTTARSPLASPSASTSARQTVAVLGFRNLSQRADAAWLSTALSEMLTTELTAAGQVRAIPGENVARMKIELKLADANSYAADTTARIRRNMGADVIVFGSYVGVGQPERRLLRVDVRVQTAATGDLVASASESGDEAALPDLVGRIGAHVRGALGVSAAAPADSAGLRASTSPSVDAIRLYAQGLAAYRQFDTVAARGLLEKAVAADPSNALARSALAAAWKTLGYDGRAREEAERAATLAASLPREQRVPIETRARALAGDARAAAAAFAELWRSAPDNLDYGLELTRFQVDAGAAKEALATLAQLRRLPAPSGDDPRLDLSEANAQIALGRPADAHVSAMTAATKGAERGAALLVGEATHVDAMALYRLSRFDECLAAAGRAERIAHDAGDANLEALSTVVASAALYTSRSDAALAGYRRSLEIFRRIGRKDGAAGVLNNLANIENDAGHFAEAARRYSEVLAIARELGRPKDAAMAMTNLGNTDWRRGELRQAIRIHEETLSAYRALGDSNGILVSLMRLTDERRHWGDLAGAHRALDEALRLSRTIEKNYAARAGSVLATGVDLRLDEGDIAGAAAFADEFMTLARGMHAPAREALALNALAAVELAQGRVPNAERHSVDAMRAVPATDSLTRPESIELLARALLAQQRAADAEAAIHTDVDISRKWFFAQICRRITAARVTEETSPSDAMAEVRAAIDDASAHGYFRDAAEGRLRLGEMQMRAGDVAQGSATLTAVERVATAKGYLLLARSARTARKSAIENP